MDTLFFYQVVAAVLVGNALTGWFAYCAWRVTRNEQSGIEPSRGPIIYLVGLALPPLLVAAGAYFLTV